MAIHFGTDGWRAVISEDFTFDNVRRVAQAIAEYFIEIGGVGAQTVVGFDTRFLSDRYAVEVARVLAGNSLIVHLANADAPTPAVSLLIIDRVCRAYNLPLHETPVGFNHIVDLMMKDDVLIGGEESGGINIRGHIPEGGGVLMGLLLLEIVAHAGVPLKELITDLQQQ